MGKLVDLTGKRFGRLTVIEQAGRTKNGRVKWKCICDCGKEAIVAGSCLTSGHTKSCGCLQPQRRAETLTKHGLRHTKLYGIRCSMIKRCFNVNDKGYKDYGGRGIKVCDEWLGESGVVNFYNWAMQSGYKEGLSIDRIDNDGDYCPENCRWATDIEQANNKRNNAFITYKDETHTISEWCRIKGISVKTFRSRLSLGWSIENALAIPVNKNKAHRKSRV